ncbi:VF530 family DNA-binding protein [Algibacillus agarilyticus]|uniref:VF530 family DNA-binding protein n=1 Tax=Algibacillus agarilyticus TaxID=2234133 RepID=UPI0018E54C94|nr:VF530 family DNA-binding protein [Algibacillus agarilyticus]
MSEIISEENPYLNNPLHGLKLETLLEELVKHYGFEILAEYTRIKCFEKKPTMESSIKFLKKTEWAREKLEAFYLYKFKSLPKPDDKNYELPPRARIIPAHIEPREPTVLVLGQAPDPKERASFNQPEHRHNNRRDATRRPSRRENNRSGYTNRVNNRNNTNDNKSSADSNNNEPWDPWGLNKK